VQCSKFKVSNKLSSEQANKLQSPPAGKLTSLQAKNVIVEFWVLKFTISVFTSAFWLLTSYFHRFTVSPRLRFSILTMIKKRGGVTFFMVSY